MTHLGPGQRSTNNGFSPSIMQSSFPGGRCLISVSVKASPVPAAKYRRVSLSCTENTSRSPEDDTQPHLDRLRIDRL